MAERDKEKPIKCMEAEKAHEVDTHTNTFINIPYTYRTFCIYAYKYIHTVMATTVHLFPPLLLVHTVNICVVHTTLTSHIIPHLPTSGHYRVYCLSSSPDPLCLISIHLNGKDSYQLPLYTFYSVLPVCSCQHVPPLLSAF